MNAHNVELSVEERSPQADSASLYGVSHAAAVNFHKVFGKVWYPAQEIEIMQSASKCLLTVFVASMKVDV